MDQASNPYRPGAGTRPLVLAGRESEIEQLKAVLQSVSAGAPQRSFMLYGLRGVGKTVLLNHAEEMATECGYQVEHLEISDTDDFRRVIAKSTRKLLTRISLAQKLREKATAALSILKAFTIAIPNGPELRIDVDAAVGIADTGDLDSDLVDLLVALGEAAQEAQKPACLLIDEVQYLSEDAARGLIASSHRIAQRSLPVMFVCAGLPSVAALAGDAKSYAERLFAFIPIDRLSREDAGKALKGPAAALGISYTDEAAEALLQIADGYPYFIQELGKHAWNISLSNSINLHDAQEAIKATTEALDQSFFKVRLDRATSSEKNFMKAMAVSGPGPYKIADVAARMQRKVNSLGPVRATLISKGFVYAPQHGIVDFTVPQFDGFLRRTL